MKHSILLILTLFIALPSLAVKAPIPGKTDPRLKQLTYNVRDVFQIHGHYGYVSHIQFDETESIKHISIGDSLAWSVTPTNNHLFLKPIEENADTNMTVLTTDNTNKVRTYSFELRAKEAFDVSDDSLTFNVSFIYPDRELAKKLATEAQRQKAEEYRQQEIIPDNRVSATDWNLDYVRKGDGSISPVHTFDDGTFTYFQFKKNAPLPAIFMVSDDGQETLINHHVKGKYVVVQRVSRQFILRYNDHKSCIYNRAFDDTQEASRMLVLDDTTSSDSDNE